MPSDAENRKIAHQAEREMNTLNRGREGKPSDSTRESGVDQSVETRFPGASVKYGSGVTGRTITPSQGGEMLKTGRMTRDRDFEGPGAPADKVTMAHRERGGDDDVQGNVRQGGGQKGQGK